MNEMTWKRPKWVLFLSAALAALLLFLAFRGIDWQQLVDTLRRGRIELLGMGFAIISFSVFLRGLRWRGLLGAELRLPAPAVFWGVSVGYLGNSFLPARAGDLVRCTLIGYHSPISKSYVLATLLTERVIDTCFLIIVSLVSLSFIHNLPGWIDTALLMLTFAAVGGLGILLLAHRLRGAATSFLVRLPLPEKGRAYAASVMEQFIRGTQAFQHRQRLIVFLGFTAIIWSCDMLSILVIAQAFDLTLTGFQAFFLLAALGLSSAVPSTPGYVGVYQFVAVTVLEPFGIARADALVFILAFQGISYLVFILWGTIGLWRLNNGQATNYRSL